MPTGKIEKEKCIGIRSDLSAFIKGASDPMPVLLDIRGTVPFLVEDKPSLMASHGFAVLCIKYYPKLNSGRLFFNDTKYFDLKIFMVSDAVVSGNFPFFNIASLFCFTVKFFVTASYFFLPSFNISTCHLYTSFPSHLHIL